MSTRHVTWALAAAVLLTAGCSSGRARPRGADGALSMGCVTGSVPTRLDRGDWMVDQRKTVWKVFEERPQAAPVHIGFLERTQYRQMRGGPEYDMYTVTTLNRREKIGRIDQVGHAFRYVPTRNRGFEEVDVGTARLEDSVGAIFQTQRRVSLEPTTERRLAFEVLDRNGDGLLQREETATLGDRIPAADANRDGVVDFQEFDAIDRL